MVRMNDEAICRYKVSSPLYLRRLLREKLAMTRRFGGSCWAVQEAVFIPSRELLRDRTNRYVGAKEPEADAPDQKSSGHMDSFLITQHSNLTLQKIK
jgi:hypothetical protein